MAGSRDPKQDIVDTDSKTLLLQRLVDLLDEYKMLNSLKTVFIDVEKIHDKLLYGYRFMDKSDVLDDEKLHLVLMNATIIDVNRRVIKKICHPYYTGQSCEPLENPIVEIYINIYRETGGGDE